MGIHPEFSSFDRRSTELDEARRAMWLWSEPIIIDRAISVYSRSLDAGVTLTMARRHSRLWRAVLCGQASAVVPLMDEIRRAAVSLALSEDVADETNDIILEELVDIVMSRHRASRNTLKTLSMVLMAVTSSLGTARKAA